jgi:hypothetical protein
MDYVPGNIIRVMCRCDVQRRRTCGNHCGLIVKTIPGQRDLRREPTIYLLPEYDTEEEARGNLSEYRSEIFEEQLDGWYRVPFSLAGQPDLRHIHPC